MNIEFILKNPNCFNRRWILTRASRICNQNFNAVDELFINFNEDKEFTVVRGVPKSYAYRFVRINKVCPNNTCTRGKWK